MWFLDQRLRCTDNLEGLHQQIKQSIVNLYILGSELILPLNVSTGSSIEAPSCFFLIFHHGYQSDHLSEISYNKFGISWTEKKVDKYIEILLVV